MIVAQERHAVGAGFDAQAYRVQARAPGGGFVSENAFGGAKNFTQAGGGAQSKIVVWRCELPIADEPLFRIGKRVFAAKPAAVDRALNAPVSPWSDQPEGREREGADPAEVPIDRRTGDSETQHQDRRKS